MLGRTACHSDSGMRCLELSTRPHPYWPAITSAQRHGCLTCSPSRLSCRRIECAVTALRVYVGREHPPSAALTAHSAPSARTRHHQRALDAIAADPSPPARDFHLGTPECSPTTARSDKPSRTGFVAMRWAQLTPSPTETNVADVAVAARPGQPGGQPTQRQGELCQWNPSAPRCATVLPPTCVAATGGSRRPPPPPARRDRVPRPDPPPVVQPDR